MKKIISMFDESGIWSGPYIDAAIKTGEYDVYRFDIKDGFDINEFSCEYLLENWDFGEVHGVIAAPPCTDFASSGAWTWPDKDTDGRTAASMELVYMVLRTVELFDPKWWVLENPVGRLPKLIPALKDYGPYYFNPCEFGDPWTKKTGLWGNFNRDALDALKTPVDPDPDSWIMKLGGKSERTKELRSETPPGFAKAWFESHR